MGGVCLKNSNMRYNWVKWADLTSRNQEGFGANSK